jgi:chromosomal replication initiation ATPase DnaA
MRLGLEDRQLTLDLPHAAASTLDDFLPAASNRRALEAVLGWPDWPATALIIDGPAGSGKTHLARIWAARAGATLLCGPEIWDVANPLMRVGGSACCVVDDADRVEDERLLLHLYNTLAERRGSLLLTARRPLAEWGIALADLRSRLRTAWIVGIGVPDDALLAALLVKQLGDRQLRVEPGVVEMLARHMERSFAAAATIVRHLDLLSLQAGRPITPGLARAVLRDLETRSALQAEAA